jgi:aminoglycoside phosphotransferase (APT) family kinase protein
MRSQHKTAPDEMAHIGQGRTAEIFSWENGRVLRLFREGASREWAWREMEVYRSVRRAGIACPAVYPTESEDGLIEIDGRFGFVMDRIDGPSMLDLMTGKPWRLWRYARWFATLHRRIHSTVAEGLPSQHERFHRTLDRISETVGSEIADRARETIEEMENGDAVCHGDFHPDNVLMSARGPVVIDWGPATSGCVSADVAWTVYLLRDAAAPPGTGPLQRLLLALFRRLFLSAYRRAYLRGSLVSWSDVKRWEPAIAAIRLGDGIPEEREPLLRVIRKSFGSTAARESLSG